ncbi:MAG TPA: MBL fold metallo-hydrolase [Spirochaetota bacterium]|nr:MBL fold metallo-hydrolase [Spirochaetota bacterium]HPJ34514.1 MBL fold metallo-hydrolase [Spirochaetota bacterium]
MKIEFVGGARTVTGSSYIIKDQDFTIMVDCGMFQGKQELVQRNQLQLIYDPPKIDCLLLTHAHIDHSGLIPKLVKGGFYGNIYTTKSTTDLCKVMLPDSAHIQENDIKWVNKRNKKLGRPQVEPLYTLEDADNSIDNFVPVNYGEIIQIHPRVEVRFRDAGHILGSSFIEMWVAEKGKKTKIVFSGDIGTKDQSIIRDPELLEDADIILIESTYGNRLHKSKEDTYTEFKEILLDSINKKGNIIIPAFAIERTQEIIYELNKLFSNGEIPRVPVYIDSPLAISATEIFRQNPQCFDEDTLKILNSGDNPLDFPNLKFTKTSEESKLLSKEKGGAIIISASGMCTAGRIKYHLQNNLYRSESSVIFVGYQAEGTLGRRIIDGAKQVKIYGEDIAVNAKVHTLGGFSAHADMNGLLEWLRPNKNPNTKVFVVHGEEESSEHFAKVISKELGLSSYVPHWGEIVDLDTMKSEYASYGTPSEEKYLPVDSQIESLTNTMNLLIKKYDRAKAENRLEYIKTLQDDINDVKEMIAVIIDEL